MAEFRGWTEVSTAAVATVAVLLLALLVRMKASHRSHRRLPPGPPGLPLLGSIPFVGKLSHRTLYELSKQYGPLMFMRLGSQNTLVVTSPKFAEEILKKHDRVTSSRPDQISANIIFRNSDIALSPAGPFWRYLKKVFTLELLTPNRISEFREIREREVLATLHFIVEESRLGNAVNMTDCLSVITVNNITQMMMNKTCCVLQRSDSKSTPRGMSLPMAENFLEMFHVLGANNIADLLPILKPFDPQGIAKRAKAVHRKLDRFLDEVIEEHRNKLSTAKTENYKDDFVDALLRIGHIKDFEERISTDSIKGILLDMVIGSGDTTVVTVLWALSELIRHPHIMRKVQEELDSVVGPHRLAQEEDTPQLKYLHAVVKEVFRLYPGGPMLIPHESSEDCEIEGFHIPARTRIFVNVWGIHRDPAVWERPLEFNPDRFLNCKFDYKGKDFEYIPFGSGRRRCPGLPFGELMVMYILSVLLHAVDFTLPEAEKLDMNHTVERVLHQTTPLIVLGKARLPNHVIYPATKVQI